MAANLEKAIALVREFVAGDFHANLWEDLCAAKEGRCLLNYLAIHCPLGERETLWKDIRKMFLQDFGEITVENPKKSNRGETQKKKNWEEYQQNGHWTRENC